MLTAEDEAQIAAQLALTKRLSLGVLLSLFPLLGVGSVAAIWIGLRGRREIKASGGKLVGNILVSWCLIAGAVGVISNAALFWAHFFR